LVAFDEGADKTGQISIWQKNPTSAQPFIFTGSISITRDWTDGFEANCTMQDRAAGILTVRIFAKKSSKPNEFDARWDSSHNLSGTADVIRLGAEPMKKSVQQVSSWNELQAWMHFRVDDTWVFRGVRDSAWTLTTTLQRQGRHNLIKYASESIPKLRQELARRHGLIFDDSDQGLAEVLALSRHHGFPSPVLDWSGSPWVALWFAIHGIRTTDGGGRFCRVYALKMSSLTNRSTSNVSQALLSPWLDGTFMQINARNTPRIAAQDGYFLVAPNLNLAGFIEFFEKSHKDVRLEAIDVPYSMATEVRRQLDRMLINEATMLPGIDGTMAYMTRKLFDVSS
jgi:hypothetical protein